MLAAAPPRAGGIEYVPSGVPVLALNVATAGEMPNTATIPPKAAGGAIGRIGVGCFQRWTPLPRLTARNRLSRPTKKAMSPSTAAPTTSPPIISRRQFHFSVPLPASSAKNALFVEPTNRRSFPRAGGLNFPERVTCHFDSPDDDVIAATRLSPVVMYTVSASATSDTGVTSSSKRHVHAIDPSPALIATIEPFSSATSTSSPLLAAAAIEFAGRAMRHRVDPVARSRAATSSVVIAATRSDGASTGGQRAATRLVQTVSPVSRSSAMVPSSCKVT